MTQLTSTSVPTPTDGVDGIWRELIDDGRWAPSPHNTRPWHVRVLSPETAELYAPRARLLPVEDPTGRFETATQGIFLEALDVAAGRRRLTVEAERRLYLRSMRGTATVGWIAEPWSTPEQCLAGGRMLLRLWLALTAHGLCLQPFGSVITNPTSHARLAEGLRVREDDREIWLLLRTGWAPEPPRSVRRQLAEVLA